jgi:hypothetical protein
MLGSLSVHYVTASKMVMQLYNMLMTHFSFLPSNARVLFNLKGLLRSFSYSTRLHVNFRKSFLVPININIERATHLANTFGCQVGGMPFTNLGLPLGTTKCAITEFAP